ncbi:uncharacterized protein LOC128549471 isoform X2 [Mercenaria mercenaria]|uniref:uncharacterized protein LOC128549471 isoform X2 n=1 Tax=Mercenaria mercenaria TaxID=6596 RepID=UPI00234EAF9B|nr:uncharacterized protein LOC128549471 isoform X2 [Mercenaria mercenaria]
MTDCCPKCGFVIEDDNKMQCGNCRRMYHFKPYCIEDSVVEMQDEDENFTCKLCALNFWPKVHPQVTKEASLEHTVHWTSKDEIQKKLKECRQLDTDVVFIDNIETSTGSGDWSAKQTKVDEKTSPVFSHRKTRLLKRKRQRSSFIYPPVTKKSRTYCVCNTVDDGRLYWNCDLCEKWYHPSCLGRDDKEEPEVFVCNTCKDAERKGEQDDTKRKGEQDDKAVTYAIPDIIKRLDEEEDAPDESDYFVDAETACKHMEAAITRASFIVSADKKNRHGRELFMARSNCFRLGGRSKYYGYGYGVFSFQARECVEIHLKKKFLKYRLAEIYLSEVLAMEGLAAIFQSLTKCGYEDADKELKKFQNKSKFKAQKDAIEQIASVKKELEKKYSPTFVSKTSPEDKLL